MKWRFVIPGLFTAAALVVGFWSVLDSINGEFLAAGQLIMIAMLLDGLDGTLARLLRGTSKFGAELDTFVDMLAFGVAPAVLLYQLVLRDAGILGAAFACLVVLSGAGRLARFRAIDPFRGQQGYLGLPITTAAGWIATFVIATQSGQLDEAWFVLHHGPLAAFFWISTLLMLLLQVSIIRYSKPTKHPAIFIPFTLLIILLFSNSPLVLPAALLILAYGFYFAFLSPLYVKTGLLGKHSSPPDEDEPLSIHRQV